MNEEPGIQSAKWRINRKGQRAKGERKPECRMQIAECRMKNREFKVQNGG
jgi:hypothetical protein